MNDEIQKKLDEAIDMLDEDNITDEETLKQRKLLNEILEVDSNNFDALYYLGLNYMATMENEQALKCFELAIQIKPEFEGLKDLIDCIKEILEIRNCENNFKEEKYPDFIYKLFAKLSPTTLFIVKIIILLVIFLLLNKFIF